MSAKYDWTEDALLTLRTMRSAGATYDEIGIVIGISRNTVIEQAKREKLRRGDGWMNAPVHILPRTGGTDPLPAGHPTSWGAITNGTVLEGVRFADVSPHTGGRLFFDRRTRHEQPTSAKEIIDENAATREA